MVIACVKPLLGLALLAMAEAALGAAPSWTTLKTEELFGNTYTRIESWADLYKWTCRWTRKDEEITVTSKWSKLVFTVNSRQAEINGVKVHLSVPIARRGSEAFISPLDLRTTLQPILFPARTLKAGQIKTICLDPGHGGRDPGNQEGKRYEKEYTLLLAKELRQHLQAAGFKVVLTRTDDSFLDLASRPEYARKQKAHLFLSLHYNAAADSNVSGVETYCLTPANASSTNARGEGANTGAYLANKNDAQNVLLSWHIQKSLLGALGAEDRGVRRARFAVLKYAESPAALIEAGFMTNNAEAKKLYDPEYRQKIAKAIVAGVQAYKKVVEK